MKLRTKVLVSFVVLALIYASVNLIAAPPRSTLQKYHVSSSSLRLLNITVVVPVLTIWLVALYGYLRLHAYTEYIRDSKEGKQALQLRRGVGTLAYWLPVSSTLSALLNLYARSHPAALAPTTILTGYLGLVFPLVGMLYISRAAHELNATTKQRASRHTVHLMAFGMIIIGVFYGYLVATAHDSIHATYHMPVLLVLLTLAVPYIFTWYLGLSAAYNLHAYTRKVRGVIYRRSWNALALGIVWIILASIALQYLTTVSAKLGDLSLGWILALIYTLLPLLAVGFVFVAIGAKRLTRIEEV